MEFAVRRLICILERAGSLKSGNKSRVYRFKRVCVLKIFVFPQRATRLETHQQHICMDKADARNRDD
eukprot:16415777-Heterocapsa_arctica.AAC.1